MKKFLKSYSLIVVFIIISAIVLMMTLYSRSLSNFFLASNDYNVRARLTETGKRLAEFTTVEELNKYTTAGDMNLPGYQRLRRELAQFAREAGVLYVYYFRVVDANTIQYIVDNDFSEETRVGLDTPPSEAGEQSETMARVLQGETQITELGQYIEGWEGIFSIYVPMFDEDGNVAAVAAVDIDDSEMLNSRRRATILLYLQIISIIGVLAFGMYGFTKYRREAVSASAADAAKSSFLSLVSHEIRTPMNSIMGTAEIQLRNKDLPPELDEAFESIYDSGNLLLNVINDVLDMSKLDARQLELIPAKYDIASLVKDILQINLLRYESKLLKFTLEIDKKTPITLIGDILRLKQILNNVLSNAFKYTDKGEVKLSVSCEGYTGASSSEDVTLVLRVSDTGRGMTEEQISRLFTEETRYNQKANRKTVGTGLGLCITKRLLDLMGGEILVESKPGKGSVFTVRIRQKTSGKQVCGSDMAEKITSTRYHSSDIPAKKVLPRTQMPDARVLLVDDVKTNNFVTKGLLVPYGIHVDTVESGFDAIDKINAGNLYDIIFMDHMMPVMDGIETVKNLRMIGYEGIIVALTANALVGQADVFLENGFNNYLSKPIDSRELDRVLNEYIKN